MNVFYYVWMEENRLKRKGRIWMNKDPIVWIAKREGEGFGGRDLEWLSPLILLTSKSLHKRKYLDRKWNFLSFPSPSFLNKLGSLFPLFPSPSFPFIPFFFLLICYLNIVLAFDNLCLGVGRERKVGEERWKS